MGIFQFSSYKKALRARLEQLKEQNRLYSFQKMAQHCRIQKTYLSRVLNREDTHLTSDQLYLAMDFLIISGEERFYVEHLYEYERSQIPQRQEALLQQLKALREKHLKTESHISAPPTEVSQREWSAYYLNPDVQLTHMFLIIPKYAKNPKLIQKALNLDDVGFTKIINTLLRLQIISINNDGYKVVRDKLHLSADSPISVPYKQLMRMRSAEHLRVVKGKTAYNFSVIFTASPKERRVVQEEFLKFLKRVEKLVDRATSEEVYQMNFDLFGWS
jgi:hypothetical protein